MKLKYQIFYTHLFTHLIGDPRRNTSIRNQRRIRSISENVIFATTSGQKIPAKHLQIGLAMKRLTCSKKVIDILNRLGHSVGYNTIEEVETELTFEATKEKRLIPDGMILDQELGTGVAFVNFDRFVEILSGKDTLHDTVGIVYQTVRSNNDTRQEEANTACEELLGVDHTKVAYMKKRRRMFDPTGLYIEPYRKKRKC